MTAYVHTKRLSFYCFDALNRVAPANRMRRRSGEGVEQDGTPCLLNNAQRWASVAVVHDRRLGLEQGNHGPWPHTVAIYEQPQRKLERTSQYAFFHPCEGGVLCSTENLAEA